MKRRRKFSGEIFVLYLILYSCGRVIIEDLEWTGPIGPLFPKYKWYSDNIWDYMAKNMTKKHSKPDKVRQIKPDKNLFSGK